MLRPATPLTILLFASFVLLLLSVLSTPVVKGIAIAEFKDVSFGVFGFCAPDKCSGIAIGYSSGSVFDDKENGDDFSLPAGDRTALTPLLVVHPIAALFNLICLGLAVAAHFHSPSHSPRYLLGLLIFLFPTLLVTLLAFLVDILLFVPHLKWGGWLVLASTILITASGVVTCAMRRTLVSRKARKKRIAENAEMSGENYYKRQDTLQSTGVGSSIRSPEPTMPAVTGAAVPDTEPILAGFATETAPYSGQGGFDQRFPSVKTDYGARPAFREQPGEPQGPLRSPSQDSRRSPGGGYGPAPPGAFPGEGPRPLHRRPSNPPLRPSGSRERMNGGTAALRGGPNSRGFRGRGGRSIRGSRGGPLASPSGAFPGPGYVHGRGGHTQGRGAFSDRNRGDVFPRNFNSGTARGGPMSRAPGVLRGPPPPGYSPSHRPLPRGHYASHEELRRKASQDGMVSPPTDTVMPEPLSAPAVATSGLEPPSAPQRQFSPAVESVSSAYSSDEVPRAQQVRQHTALDHSSSDPPPSDDYIPPRSGWNNGGGSNSPNYSRPTLHAVDNSNPINPDIESARRPRATSSVYYEDVAPSFSNPPPQPPPMTHDPNMLPRSLTAGNQSHHQNGRQPSASHENNPPPPDTSGPRSPTGSEISHFTSVSQRGVNPRWHDNSDNLEKLPAHNEFGKNQQQRGMGKSGGNGIRNRDVLLQTNPDFAIPGMGPPRSGALRGAKGPGAAGPGAAATAGPSGMGQPPATSIPLEPMGGAGRYPPAL